jgi:hypothetical protein
VGPPRVAGSAPAPTQKAWAGSSGDAAARPRGGGLRTGFTYHLPVGAAPDRPVFDGYRGPAALLADGGLADLGCGPVDDGPLGFIPGNLRTGFDAAGFFFAAAFLFRSFSSVRMSFAFFFVHEGTFSPNHERLRGPTKVPPP